MADQTGTPVEGQKFVLKIGTNKIMGCIPHALDFSEEKKDNTTKDFKVNSYSY